MEDVDQTQPVVVDEALQDLIPMFMSRREADIEALRAGLATQDFDALRHIGHSLKGTAGGYGFHWLTAVGARIEEAAKAGDAATIADFTEQMDGYLRTVEIRFEE